MDDELKIGQDKEKETKEPDFKELYGGLRNTISGSRDSLAKALNDVKDKLEQIQLQRDALTQQEELLTLKRRKLEGAIEVTDSYLKANLPSHKK